MAMQDDLVNMQKVAPVRERGLKCTGKYDREGSASRSREGAWIEIRICLGIGIVVMSLP